jgi:renalase
MRSCVIVGAGLSGLIAARRLEEVGIDVTVFEKENKVGGRMRTDRIEDATFDHGAQFFTVRKERFGEIVEDWVSAGVAEVWAHGFADENSDRQEDGYPRYKGTRGMATIAEYLARDLDVKTESEVTWVNVGPRGWEVAVGGLKYPADALILALPAPLALTLVDDNDVPLPAKARRTLEGIGYDPCIAVMALLEGPASVPEPGGVQIGGDTLFWVADNQKKGISRVPAVTIHAGPEWSREHAESDNDTVISLLLEEAKDYVGTEAKATAVYRWEHSWVAKPHEEPFIYVEVPPPLVFCGDAYAGPKLEGAALSGLAAAEKLLVNRWN